MIPDEQEQAIHHPQSGKTARKKPWQEILIFAALIFVLAVGAYLRLVGVNWDENQHMHPDERFLSLVQVAISPVEDVSEYFNTETSSLNPANRGYPFFVYGTLPIFITRYLGEIFGRTDYHAITLLGRQVSAIFDLVTVMLVYVVGRRLYNRWTGLVGAAFYALAVLPIQLSHFATVDTVTNAFALFAVYCAIWALTRKPNPQIAPISRNLGNTQNDEAEEARDARLTWRLVWRILQDLAPYILFGAALGAATASKINAVTLAVMLPLVEFVRYLRLDPENRRKAISLILRNLAVAGIISFLIFRIGQPYAFNGPGFFNLGINENWWSSLASLRAQASGDVDFPPALQWARRPITFSLENLVIWGFGLPLGLFAWLAYLGMGVMIFRKENWHQHLPLWAFIGLYFIWQSFSWVRSMRYQMLIYPGLALVAGWGLVRMIQTRKPLQRGFLKLTSKVIRVFGIVLTVIILTLTACWAYSFSRIYTRPHTRIAASRWIYQNIPGALTLEISTGEGKYQQPLPYRAGDQFDATQTYKLPFYGVADATLSKVNFPQILDELGLDSLKQVNLSLVSADNPHKILGRAKVEDRFLPEEGDGGSTGVDFIFNDPVQISDGSLYYLYLNLLGGDASLRISGSPILDLTTNEGMSITYPLPRILQSVKLGSDYVMNIQLVQSGTIHSIFVPYLVDQAGVPGDKSLEIILKLPDQQGQKGLTSSGSISGEFQPGDDIRGAAYRIELEEPLVVEKGQVLTVILTTPSEDVQLVPHAPAPVHESSWDDAIPYPVDGFSPYHGEGGIYRGDLNFEMYWPDNALKLEKFETNLDLADYIFITSNRQWGTTTRVPERYLLTTHYYQNLLGCPAEEDLLWCYSVAEPGMFEGSLGFELVAVFQSNPNLGSVEINSQFAEEAFTVYDHPKVLIFQKTDEYDPLAVRQILRSVDLNKVVYFTPGDAVSYQGPNPDELYEPRHNLMLPDDRWELQQTNGTWSDLFSRESFLNRSQPLAAAVFYLLITFLGVLAYPILRLALPGLADRGYPLARLGGMLILTLVVWLLGSLGIPFTAATVLFVLAGMIVMAAILICIQWETIRADLQERWRYYLTVEVLALIAFVFFLLVRFGNPDLWHPFKGGEKPMDFSYLNAVLKSRTFPPYDPWFAGGYINYYYYGFLIVGVPIKLLGIVPAVAYNIILPIWYAILVLASFSVGWNLYQGIPRSRALRAGEMSGRKVLRMAFWVGLATAIGLALLGNLGTVRLILDGYQRLAAGGADPAQANLGQQIRWTIQGFIQFMQGTPMPFYPGDWYWFPSRVIPGEPITEFPYFSFIYGDLHAHLIAFPITVFAISWSLSVVLSKGCWGEKDGRFKWFGTALGFILGGIVIGALRPTNTWDFYTYIVLAALTLGYTFVRYYQPRFTSEIGKNTWLEKVLVALSAVGLLVLLAMLFYQPFSYWFRQGYTRIEIWRGSRTPLDSYFTHWGLFLFLIFSWMGWETYHWMKTTPQSSLKNLDPYKSWIHLGLILFGLILFIFLVMGVHVALVVLPAGVWVVILMLRPNQSDGRRFLLFLVGTALTLTLVVELIYLPGDIGRMNTVFKFYLQAWIMLAISAGVCLGWLIKSLRYWDSRLEFIWQAIFYALVASAALFTVLGTVDKIRDRMAPEAPHTLDGMAFMRYANYYDMGSSLNLSEDYFGILWMQDNVEGTPVIVEGQAYEYRWGNRYTIYTGLPGVVGWNWHQRQQRAVLRSNIVQERVDAVGEFYFTEDLAYVEDFLEDYNVKYIIFGGLERVFFPGPGLEKFAAYEGELWEKAYEIGNTIIYKVLD